MLNVFESGKLKDIERVVIKARLDQKNWNRTHTARDLGIGIRTLQRKMKSMGLLAEEPVTAKAEEGANAEG